MWSLLTQLQDSEAILLMYLADELPPGDRAEVERRLAADPQLAAQFEALRANHASVQDAIGSLDRAQRAPGNLQSNQRAISRLIRQWQTRRLASTAAAPAQSRSHWVWALPTIAAAAIVLLGIGVWWGIQPVLMPEIQTGQIPGPETAQVSGPETTQISGPETAQVSGPETEVVVQVNDDLDGLAQAAQDNKDLAYMGILTQ